MPLKNFLNVTEASEVIGCSEGHVRKMLRDGVLKGQKLSERAWAITRTEAVKMRDTEHDLGRPRKSAKISA